MNIKFKIKAIFLKFKSNLYIFCGAFIFYATFLPFGLMSPDEMSMWNVSHSIVYEGSISTGDPEITGIVGRKGIDGRYYSRWYPLNPILALPFVFISKTISSSTSIPPKIISIMLTVMTTMMITASTACLINTFSQKLGATKTLAFLCSMSFAFGSIALTYSQKFFSEPFSAFFILLSVYWAFSSSKYLPLAIFLVGLAKPPFLAVGGIIAIYVFFKRKRLKNIFPPLLASAAAFGIYLAYNYYCFGDPLSFGQFEEAGATKHSENATFQIGGFFGGFFGQLVSPGFGLIWYSPPLILAIYGIKNLMKKDEYSAERKLIYGIFLFYLTLYSCWKGWNGGWSWGSRFIMIAIPCLLVMVSVDFKKCHRLLIVLLTLGFFANVPNLISYSERFLLIKSHENIKAEDIAWSIKNSPLLNAWPNTYGQYKVATEQDVKLVMARPASKADTQLKNKKLNTLSAWWWILPAYGIPRWASLVLASILITLSLFIFKIYWKSIKSLD